MVMEQYLQDHEGIWGRTKLMINQSLIRTPFIIGIKPTKNVKK